MQVLLIADADFFRREHALISRLELGLVGEGFRISLALPVDAPISDQRVYTNIVRYILRGPMPTRARRTEDLLSQVPGLDSGRELDIVHVLGEGAWTLGAAVARRSEARLALEVWRTSLIRRAIEFADNSCVLLAPDHSIERAILREGSRATVRFTPWGVPVEPRPEHGEAPAITIVGTGADARACRAALEGIASIAPLPGPAPMIFIDAGLARRAGLWAHARRLRILDRVTLIPDAEAHRGLPLRGDLLVQPEAMGEVRSLTLEAMGAGMGVVARADPAMSHLLDGRTARLVTGDTPAAWAEAVGTLLADHGLRRALGESAREFIRAEHRPTAHIAGMIDAYEWMAAHETIPFRAG